MTMSPFEDLVTTFTDFLKQQIPLIQTCGEGWPDPKFLATDGNLPGVFLVIPSSRKQEHRGRFYNFTETAADPVTNQGTITHVVGKRQYPIQCHVIAMTKLDVVHIHDAIINKVESQWYLPLTDNGFNSKLDIEDDFFLTKGEETNYHRSIVIVNATLRNLSSETAYGFKQANVSATTGTSSSDSVQQTVTLDVANNKVTITNK